MMVQHTCSIGLLLVSAALAAIGVQRTGWLDRVVQYQKEKFVNEVRELAPININAEIRPKPEGYIDSEHWDYDSVLRLLTLIRGSETAKPVLKPLRRMLQPTRRLMMSIKESMHRFPSIKKDDNAFYYDVDYTSSEEGHLPAPPPVPEDEVVLVVSNPVEARLPSARISVKLLRLATFYCDVDYTSSEEGHLPAPPPVPEDEVVLVVSNPVEARLPSARISVKLLRQILEARARAARQMPTTTIVIPWVEFVKKKNTTTTASTAAVKTTTEGKASDQANATTVADDTTVAVAGGDEGATDTGGGGEASDTTVPDAGGDQNATVAEEGAANTTDAGPVD